MSSSLSFLKKYSNRRMLLVIRNGCLKHVSQSRGIRTARNPSIIKPRKVTKTSVDVVSEPLNDVSEGLNLAKAVASDAVSEFRREKLTSSTLKDLETSSVSHLDQNPEFPSDAESLNSKMRDINWLRDQKRHAFRPKVNPSDTSLLLFPGQGSQFVGMGKKLLEYPKVEQMYNVASDILGYDLLDVCLNGPKETLSKTTYCQPAVMVTSLAAVEKLKNTKPWAVENCITAAGYSIGEYAALVFAGAVSFEDGVRLVKVRAEAMQKASEEVPGGMMTVFFNAEAKIRFACHAARLYCSKELQMPNPVCEVSNYLYSGCKVIAGNSEALDFIAKNAGEFGIKRFQHLPVSGAFHTPLMLPAKKQLLSVLSSTELRSPIVPVHSNVNSFKYRFPKDISKLLVEQLFKPVKWEQTMHVLYSRPEGEKFPHTFEVGPGRHLGFMLKVVNLKGFQMYSNIEC